METIRRDLNDFLAGLKIKKVEIRDKKIFGGGEGKKLEGDLVKKIGRQGKLLVFELKSGLFLLIHLKMTGQLVLSAPDKLIGGGHPFKKGDFQDQTGGKLPNKHTRFVLYFPEGVKLFFNDIRRFGYVKLVEPEEKTRIVSQLGPEPLTPEFSFQKLKEAFKNRKANIKSVLLNQKIISGIGNIYADEVLFSAGIDPRREAGSLDDEEIKKILSSGKKIIKKAIKYRGTTFSDYRDGRGGKGNFEAFLKVYGREGEKCPKCSGKIKKITLASRGTHYCPGCQK